MFEYIDSKFTQNESMVSKEIKVIAEVEKMWILYDIDNSGSIELQECTHYLNEMAYPALELTNDQVKFIFNVIDFNGDGSIDKQEMICFLKVLMLMQSNLSFKSSSTFFSKQYEIERTKMKEQEKIMKQQYSTAKKRREPRDNSLSDFKSNGNSLSRAKEND